MRYMVLFGYAGDKDGYKVARNRMRQPELVCLRVVERERGCICSFTQELTKSPNHEPAEHKARHNLYLSIYLKSISSLSSK